MRLSNKNFRLASAHTSASGTDVLEYYPSEAGWHNPGYKEVRVKCRRTAETGTCTLDVILQEKNIHTGLWTDCRGLDGAVVDGIQYADGTVETTAEHELRLGVGACGQDADGYLVVNTVNAYFEGCPPEFFRVKVKNGGTTVTNTYDLSMQLLQG